MTTEKTETTAAGRWPASAVAELTSRPTGQMPALDGLRAAAVLLVIGDHWVYEWVTVAKHTAFPLVHLPVFHWGWTGVDLFFVLSGFLIGRQLWSEVKRTGSIRVVRFVLRRGLRIWPLYYACMAIFAFANTPKAPVLPDFAMYSNYVQTAYARSWSLSTEEQFYVFVPLAILAFLRFFPVRRALIGIGVLLMFVALARYFTIQNLAAAGLTPKQISDATYSPFHLHSEPLLIGLSIAWVSVYRSAWLTPRSDTKPAITVLAIALLLAAAAVALRMYDREVFAYLALGGVYGAALIAALADRSWVTAVLRWSPLYVIARLSFGMYLNHLVLREPTETIMQVVNSVAGDSPIAFLAGLVFTVICSAITAAITFVLVEQPGLALRDRWLSHHSHKQVTTA